MLHHESLARKQLFSAGFCGTSRIWSMLNRGSPRESQRPPIVFGILSQDSPRPPMVFRSLPREPRRSPSVSQHMVPRQYPRYSAVSHGLPRFHRRFRGDPHGNTRFPVVYRVNLDCIPRYSKDCRGFPRESPRAPTVFPGRSGFPARTLTGTRGLQRVAVVLAATPPVLRCIPWFPSGPGFPRGCPWGFPRESMAITDYSRGLMWAPAFPLGQYTP